MRTSRESDLQSHIKVVTHVKCIAYYFKGILQHFDQLTYLMSYKVKSENSRDLHGFSAMIEVFTSLENQLNVYCYPFWTMLKAASVGLLLMLSI